MALLGLRDMESYGGGKGRSNLCGFHRDSGVCQAFVMNGTDGSKWPGL